MKFITTEGKIEDGFLLSAEEVEIVNSSFRDGIDAAVSTTFISERTANQIMAYFLREFRLSRRNRPAPPVSDDETWKNPENFENPQPENGQVSITDEEKKNV